MVGLGDIAHAHARVLRRLGQRLSFCSRDENTAAGFQSTYDGVATYTDLATALEHPDIQSCVICLPHDLHETCAAAALAAKRHVLLEKPIAHTMASAERIVTLAAGSGTAFMLAEQMDYLPVLGNVRNLAAPVSYVFTDQNDYVPAGWRTRLEASGGGVMLDLGIHYVSFAAKAFGPIASHRKETRRMIPGTRVPSSERLFIRHTNGVEGEVDVAWSQPSVARSMVVRTASSVFRYRQDSRIAMLGRWPQFVAVRSTNGREQMTNEYLSRCQSPGPVHDIADALPILAAVL